MLHVPENMAALALGFQSRSLWWNSTEERFMRKAPVWARAVLSASRFQFLVSSDSSSSPKQTAATQSILKEARILVVEDEPDTREMIAHAVKQRGAKPVQADSAKKALRLLEHEPAIW